MYLTILAVSSLVFVQTRFIYAKGLERYPGKSDWRVYDVGHEVLPDLSRQAWWLDSLIPCGFIAYLGICGKVGVTADVLSLALPLYLLRMITTMVTIFPSANANHTCTEATPRLMNYISGVCHDNQFSGHTMLVIILSVVAFKTHPAPLPIIAAVGALEAILLVASRGHYTVDVIVSAVLTYCFLKLDVRLKL